MNSSQGPAQTPVDLLMASQSTVLVNFTAHARESVSGVASIYLVRTCPVMVNDPAKHHDARNLASIPIMVATDTDLDTLRDGIRRFSKLHQPPNLKVVLDLEFASNGITDLTAENFLPLLRLIQIGAGPHSIVVERLHL